MLTFKATEMEVTGTPTRVGSLEKGENIAILRVFSSQGIPSNE
jgi:hypothetical protein